MSQHENKNLRAMLFNYLIELVLYGALVLLYFYFVLQPAAGFIAGLLTLPPALYALVSIMAIFVQAAFLEVLVSIIVNSLGLRWPRK